MVIPLATLNSTKATHAECAGLVKLLSTQFSLATLVDPNCLPRCDPLEFEFFSPDIMLSVAGRMNGKDWVGICGVTDGNWELFQKIR